MLNPICIDALNPSPMTGRGNNTYLIVSPDGDALLVDAGVGHPQHLAEIDRELRSHSARLSSVVVTHAHADHISGAPALAAAHRGATFAKYPWPDEDARDGLAWQPLADGDVVRAGHEELRVVHTPGHAVDHIALWHEPTRTVFSGDLVIQGSSVMIHTSRGGRLSDYLASLERLRVMRPRVLLPAHGDAPVNPDALLTSYLEHRALRERQVIAALAAGRSTVPAIVESIYDGLDPALAGAAHENVKAHLQKLKVERRAEDEADSWRLL